MTYISKIGLCLFLSGTLAIASNSILEKKFDLIQNGKTIGFVQILTPVEIIKSNKENSVIKIKGFRLENYPQMIVRDIKRKELYAEFKDETIANNSFKILKTYEDEYGEVWHEVEGEFTVSTNTLTKDKDNLYLNAKKTYERTCSMCHHLPLSTAYTVNQWPQQIESMMEQVALDDTTKNLIIKYLQQNAADAK